jgi:hypothetical protein
MEEKKRHAKRIQCRFRSRLFMSGRLSHDIQRVKAEERGVNEEKRWRNCQQVENSEVELECVRSISAASALG